MNEATQIIEQIKNLREITYKNFDTKQAQEAISELKNIQQTYRERAAELIKQNNLKAVLGYINKNGTGIYLACYCINKPSSFPLIKLNVTWEEIINNRLSPYQYKI